MSFNRTNARRVATSRATPASAPVTANATVGCGRIEFNVRQILKGYSAYDIAVQNGFEGTEEEWLASLQSGGELLKVTSINGGTAAGID